MLSGVTGESVLEDLGEMWAIPGVIAPTRAGALPGGVPVPKRIVVPLGGVPVVRAEEGVAETGKKTWFMDIVQFYC